MGLGYLYQAELIAGRRIGLRAIGTNGRPALEMWKASCVGRACLDQQQVLKARSWFAAAARQNSVAGHNSLAWLLATFNDARLRDADGRWFMPKRP